MFDYRKLKGRIVEVCGTQNVFAEKIGRSKTYVSQVLHNKSVLDQNDINAWAAALGVSLSQYAEYFFCPASSQNETEGGN